MAAKITGPATKVGTSLSASQLFILFREQIAIFFKVSIKVSSLLSLRKTLIGHVRNATRAFQGKKSKFLHSHHKMGISTTTDHQIM
jgi:hypothetical protein